MTETNGFTIIAHRGFSEKLPENTFPAFDLAIGLGVHNLELDVQLTKDKIPVIIHDSNLLRTTGVNDLVSERKYDQIKFLEAVNEFSVAGEEYRIPKLTDVLDRYKNEVHLHLELKSGDQDLPELVYRYLNEKSLYEVGGITISSFRIEQLIRFEKITNSERTAWLVNRITENRVASCAEHNINLICPIAKFADSDSVDVASEKQIEVRNWGVLSIDDLINAYNLGSTGSTVDWPLKAKEVLARMT